MLVPRLHNTGAETDEEAVVKLKKVYCWVDSRETGAEARAVSWEPEAEAGWGNRSRSRAESRQEVELMRLEMEAQQTGRVEVAGLSIDRVLDY